jgi:hypothetical protein
VPKHRVAFVALVLVIPKLSPNQNGVERLPIESNVARSKLVQWAHYEFPLAIDRAILLWHEFLLQHLGCHLVDQICKATNVVISKSTRIYS